MTVPFRAPIWLRTPHAQTIGGKIFRSTPQIELRRERLELPDGDFVDLDFGPSDEDWPLVVAMHGLEGSATRRYMLQLYAALARRGIAAVGVNFRSCSGEPNRTARFYHSGETEDLRAVLAHLRSRFPERRMGGAGFSLGGNVLLKYLGEMRDNAELSAAAAISVPYDLAAGAGMLERWPMGRFYSWYFIRMLRPKVTRMREIVAPHCNLDDVLRARTLREFDEAFTAPLHGFTDAADYYDRSSSAPYVARIRVPTLLIHAEDDPFLPSSRLPRAAAASNPHVRTAFSARGGHVGFIGGTPWRPVYWAEETAAGFLATELTVRRTPRTGASVA